MKGAIAVEKWKVMEKNSVGKLCRSGKAQLLLRFQYILLHLFIFLFIEVHDTV